MAKHDPIVGRYVYVLYGGEEYRTYYEENGEGIPLVCLHTAGTDGREWRHQLCDPDITKNFRVIAFDLPRHGKSIPPGDFYKEEEEYKLTSKFYSEFIVAFCQALELKKPVIMGSSMGGNVCLPLALNFENEFSALIAVEACDHSPGWWIDPLHNPHIHGGEVCATSVFGLMAPQSPDIYRWEPGGITHKVAQASLRAICISIVTTTIFAICVARSPARCRSISLRVSTTLRVPRR